MTTRPDTERPADADRSPPQAVESWRSFANWAVEQLGAKLDQTPDGYRVHQPAPSDAEATTATTGSGIWSLATRKRNRRQEPEDIDERLDFAASTTEELLDQLLAEIAKLSPRPTLAPTNQPTATREIAERLFSAYQIDGGKVHLAGCRLEPTRLLRWSVRGEDSGNAVVRHTYTDLGGNPLPPGLFEALQLDGEMVEEQHHSKSGARLVDTVASVLPSNETAVPTATILLLRAVGVLEASIGESNLAIPFDDWALTLTAPPARCPETGRETFHLLAINDDQIVAAEATGVCEATGHRLLLSELRTCCVSGKQLSAELGSVCPITQDWVATDRFAVCPKCQLSVSGNAVGPKDCRACRDTEPVPANSPLRESLLEAAPLLSGWKNWRIAETRGAVQIVEASTFWKRLVVVIDRESGKATHAATKPRFGGVWSPLPLHESA